tara:strand:- start:4251 stop:5780 length:1530 start_codon:yes stop_codon:yes gene_type:complete
MALPKIDKLSSEFTVSENDSGAVKNEIVKLGQAIFDKTNSSLKSATQSVIGDVPTMIKSLTEEIERGPVDSFGNAMNKLIKITQELGINLYDYNEGLAKSVEEFTGNQEKLEKKLNELREQGIRGTIENNTIKLLTEKEVLKLVEKRKDNEIKIVEKTTAREKLQLALDSTVHTTSKKRDKAQDAIIKNEKEISKLKLDNEEIEKKTTVTADTGRDQGGFGKLAELKEAFMVIPDTIADVATGFADVGKSIYGGIAQFIGAPMKTLGKAFKGIANIFKTARLMIALKVLLIIAALQFVAENIGKIIGVFKNIWNKVTDFFKGIVDWFKNSAVGKFFGLGGDDTTIEPNKAAAANQMDDGTYAIGQEDVAAPENANDEFLPQSKDPLAAPVVDPVTNNIIQPGEEGYDKARENRMQDTQSYMGDEQKVNAINELRSVTGDNAGDGSTSSMLKSLEKETKTIAPNVINVQNNNSIANNTSGGSSATIGFNIHEPDNTFKYVRQGSTASNDF